MQSKYSITNPKEELVSIFMFFVLLLAILLLNNLVRPDFNGFEFIRRYLFDTDILLRLGTLGIGVVTLLIYIIAHEGIHGGFLWIFTRRRPSFKRKGVYPYTVPPVGVCIFRNQTLIALLSPFVIFTGLFVIWPIVPAPWVAIILLLIPANFAGSISDFRQSRWLLGFNSNSRYGFDGQDMVIRPSDIKTN